MQIESTMERIRQGIRAVMAQWCAESDAIEQETILVQDGHYCGRRFRGATVQAVWFLEEEQVKFYDGDGALLEVYSTDQIKQQGRRNVA